MFTKQNGASKPSGMDMMIGSILKGMGVAPDALTTYIEQGKALATQFVVAMQSVDARLKVIEEKLDVMRRESKSFDVITMGNVFNRLDALEHPAEPCCVCGLKKEIPDGR